MFGEKLPFDVADAVFVSPIWYRGEQSDVAALYNTSIAPQTFTLLKHGKPESVTLPPMTIKTLEL